MKNPAATQKTPATDPGLSLLAMLTTETLKRMAETEGKNDPHLAKDIEKVLAARKER